MMVHGEVWTMKELFVYPNEFVYWTVQIVMYPFMTGLVAGAFVLSSLYHVFGVKQLKEIARFALVFSFALLPAAGLPLLLHLLQPQRNAHVFMTPHFTSAIAAFGIVFSTYAAIVAAEIWFLYRKHFVETALKLKKKLDRTFVENMWYLLFSTLTLGSYDISEKALHQDEKGIRILAGIGIPVACFLHGYVGFIFGSVKANALWMTPLMPVIFLMSAVVSGIALCMLTYIIVMELRKFLAARKEVKHQSHESLKELKSAEIHVMKTTTKYLLIFLMVAITLELLDLIFRGYTANKSWDVLRTVIYGRDFMNIFVLQYGIGNLVPYVLLLLPGLTIRRTVIGSLLVLFGIFMMRWNVVIGGQAFSLSFAGFMHYHLPIIPNNIETFKEGVGGILLVAAVPLISFWVLNKVIPVFVVDEGH